MTVPTMLLGPAAPGAVRARTGAGERLRLLLVADSLDIGGAERHLVGLAAALVDAGHDVMIACSIAGGLEPMARQRRVVVRQLGHRLVKRRVSMPFARGLACLLSRERFDLVHAHMYASAAAAALACLGQGVPLVITEHSQAGWRGALARGCSRLVYRRAAHVIAVSQAIRDRLVQQDAVPLGRVSVILNALPPLASGAPLARAALVPAGVGPGTLVGAVARLQPEKGLADFIRAAAVIAVQAPDAQFLIVGDGPQRAELARLAERLGLAERLKLLGFRLDAPALIR
ncbi:MAG: glycosyltransferase, partial [Chloroflexi bacterium]|nr:glycosyltransferase [Chloroflexota bacterium]